MQDPRKGLPKEAGELEARCRISIGNSTIQTFNAAAKFHYVVSVNHATHEGIDGDLFHDTCQSFRQKQDIYSLIRIVDH
jgi:hypothetical protein